MHNIYTTIQQFMWKYLGIFLVKKKESMSNNQEHRCAHSHYFQPFADLFGFKLLCFWNFTSILLELYIELHTLYTCLTYLKE